ncbi:MAG TPA: 1-deoxy-D-xylulose-5-phosphate reductoisomerase [Nitrospiria bacterium]|nr:1-deoxy-D-xylulose-5-phosphate reductoisomerase [Nitrospiria bacterium]
MKKLIIFGSTGSIGTNTLNIVSQFPECFQVVGLTAGWNGDKLEQQMREFRPRIVSLATEQAATDLRRRCRDLKTEILWGLEGAIAVATHPEADLAVSGIVGAAGLVPTLSAIKAGKDVALANKETMVMAGEMIRQEAILHGVRILPVDSEHSAIFQALAGHRREDVRRIILTASGGPFLDTPLSKRRKVTPREAVRHPNWNMGAKISVDSATLMNKGLEVIEARWLFDFPPERIDILIHRQSIIHSMVEYVDGSVMAQMGIPDMRGPIAYALNYPERLPLNLKPLDLVEVGALTFMRPNPRQFPCLGMAYQALRIGGTMPCVLNAANEEAVSAFLKEQIGFLEIPKVIQKTVETHDPQKVTCLEDVINADGWAREKARQYVKSRTTQVS